MMMDRRMFLRTGSAVTLAMAGAAALAACGSKDSGSSDAAEAGPSAAAAAAEAGGELLVWAWDTTIEPVAKAFMEKYPKVTVTVTNVGTSADQYTALQNAISAGKGGPDVAQVEYYALPQFSLADSLTDLAAYGAADLAGTYSAGPWAAVASGDAVHGLPMDSGPLALFYNEEVFTRLGVEVPTTWDEYLEAARAIHAADAGVYIANDVGDPVKVLSLLWQAGSRPYTVKDTTVGIDFGEDTTTAYADLWTTLISEDLLYPAGDWTDEWYQGLGNGTIASLLMGAWMPASFVGSVEAGSGKWKVAPVPGWGSDEAGAVSAEMGGSALAVTKASKNAALAYHFVHYANAGDGVPPAWLEVPSPPPPRT